jgi:hypothetical protein
MSDSEAPKDSVPPRLRRALELVYGVEGVVAARAWQWTEESTRGEKVAIGVRPSAVYAPSELLRRVEAAVDAIRQPGEAWEFGLLDHA